MNGPLGNSAQRILGEGELGTFHFKQAAILLDQRILGLGQNLDQRLFVQILKRCHHGQAADEFRDQAEFQQILGLHLTQDFPGTALIRVAHFSAEANARTLAAGADDLFKPGKCATANEQDVRRIHLQEFLLRMLAPALRRHGSDRAFHDLEQRLLHPLPAHVARDGWVVRFAADLVHFINIDNAALGAFHIVIRSLQQLEDDVLHILTHIAGFGERGGIRHGEGHIKNAGQRLRQQRLARTGWPDQHDVGFGNLNIRTLTALPQPLVMVVDSNRQHTLGVFLADHIIIQNLADFLRCRHAIA